MNSVTQQYPKDSISPTPGKANHQINEIQELISQLYGQQNVIETLVHGLGGSPPLVEEKNISRGVAQELYVNQKLSGIISSLYGLVKKNNDIQDYLRTEI